MKCITFPIKIKYNIFTTIINTCGCKRARTKLVDRGLGVIVANTSYCTLASICNVHALRGAYRPTPANQTRLLAKKFNERFRYRFAATILCNCSSLINGNRIKFNASPIIILTLARFGQIPCRKQFCLAQRVNERNITISSAPGIRSFRNGDVGDGVLIVAVVVVVFKPTDDDDDDNDNGCGPIKKCISAISSHDNNRPILTCNDSIDDIFVVVVAAVLSTFQIHSFVVEVLNFLCDKIILIDFCFLKFPTRNGRTLK
ncbi:hypothetical protein DERP_003404 [Dermatophagoides pteronyssinus]|uniref:Uncharacterized protein n=1 Tax=Dermatophagoides pteronyssinus TaxID=6956 RepID=A0ABQ8JK05_DERPT|nr:hypothetical protein DERP_003404 [Dermatophagoides pteronyssinus]